VRKLLRLWISKSLATGFCLLLCSSLFVSGSHASEINSNSNSNSKTSWVGEIDPAVETLFELIKHRLTFMEAVANYKWQRQLQIEDLQREQVVLDNAVKDAATFRLEPQSSRTFFSSQIQAAKEIQLGWFDHWRRTASPSPGPDLKSSIRPQLIKLGKRILRQLELTREELIRSERSFLEKQFLNIVDVAYLSDGVKLKLFNSLVKIETLEKSPATFDSADNTFPVNASPVNASRLDLIIRRGEIKVGTTGDYAPFSWLDANSGQYSGIDIDMARDLAASLGVKLVLVPTTWPMLINDFQADKYDLAMSGVSISLKRQKLGFFSLPYHSGGKTPITLCSKVDEYNSLAKIDQPTTRVVVNPGGTNFRFASSHLSKAKVRTFDNNQTIFSEITEGRADLMITDAIEVRLQAQHNKKLCAAMPGETLTKSEKGYWVQADIHLKEYINTWLRQRQLQGVVSHVFEQHVGAFP
jgi:cyclohexadienyl dehydratase